MEEKEIAPDNQEEVLNMDNTEETHPKESGDPEFNGGDEGNDALQEMKQQIEELKDKNLRLFAEFDNYRKRTTKERFDLIKTAGQDTLSALLPVLDDFDRFSLNVDASDEQDPFREGVKLVYQKMYNTLIGLGLVALDSTGQPFDADLHEAIANIPAPEPKQNGMVADTVQKGYLLNDKLIRHAKVVVFK